MHKRADGNLFIWPLPILNRKGLSEIFIVSLPTTLLYIHVLRCISTNCVLKNDEDLEWFQIE
jgi:hypothetical protein